MLPQAERSTKQTVAKLRKYSQVQGMTWYLLRDESDLAGWQSGFLTYPKSHRVEEAPHLDIAVRGRTRS